MYCTTHDTTTTGSIHDAQESSKIYKRNFKTPLYLSSRQMFAKSTREGNMQIAADSFCLYVFLFSRILGAADRRTECGPAVQQSKHLATSFWLWPASCCGEVRNNGLPLGGYSDANIANGLPAPARAINLETNCWLRKQASK